MKLETGATLIARLFNTQALTGELVQSMLRWMLEIGWVGGSWSSWSDYSS